MVKYIEPLEELYRTFIRYLFLRKKEDWKFIPYKKSFL
jgi:hypothetical protein